MKEFYKEIFEYHHHFNQKLIGEITTHFSVLPERTFPLFCHVLNAHHIWNSRLMRVSNTFTVQQVHELSVCASIDDANYVTTLRILDDIDFNKMITYKTFAGSEFTSRVNDILFHVNNHSTHHKAQIISDFRQKDIQPIALDYIWYKR